MSQIVKLLQDAIQIVNEQEGDDVVSLRESYSGRSMYRRTCVGITGSDSDCQHVIGEAIKAAASLMDAEDNEVSFEEVVDTLLDFKRDSMGRDVILYWQEIPAIEIEEVVDDAGPECPSYTV